MRADLHKKANRQVVMVDDEVAADLEVADLVAVRFAVDYEALVDDSVVVVGVDALEDLKDFYYCNGLERD